jgi:DNA-binding protein HU-beta
LKKFREAPLAAKLHLTLGAAGHAVFSMNKAAFVDEVQKQLGGVSRAAAERATEAVLEAVKKGLKREGEVLLVGFGAFSLAQRPARKGFNPHTRQPMKIPAMKQVRFKAGSDLKAIA